MIVLHTFPNADGIPPSPFTAKAEIYLRLAGLPYRCLYYANPAKAPKGKYPVIDDDGTVVPDSEFIVAYLKKKYGDKLDGAQSAEQRATARAIGRMVDEGLYFVLVYYRWCDDALWPALEKLFFGGLPPVIRTIVPVLVRRRVKQMCWMQGISRHTPAEIADIGGRDIAALAVLLGNKPYMMGEDPCSLDATVYGFLQTLLWFPIANPMTDAIKAEANLVAYAERMRARIDWPKPEAA